MSMTVAPSGYADAPAMMQQSVILQAQQRIRGLKPWQQKSMRNVSALQVVTGAVCVLVHIVLLGIHRYNYGSYAIDLAGTGIWCGVFFVTSGTLGLCAAKRNTISLIAATMAMSIISSIAVWCVIGFAAAGLGISGANKERCYNPYHYSYYGCQPARIYNGYQAADSLLLIFAVTEFIVAIWSSSLGCRVVCCCYGYATQPVYYMTYPAGGQQVVFIPQQGLNIQPMMMFPQQGHFTGQQSVLMPSGAGRQAQTTYMPATGGVMPPAFSQPMMPLATQVAGGYGEVEKQPLPPAY